MLKKNILLFKCNFDFVVERSVGERNTMAQNLKTSANQIIEGFGGRNNIKLVTHCVTRIRVALLDQSLIDRPALEKIPVVTGVVNAQGQWQLVIGPTLIDALYQQLNQQLQTKKFTQVSSKIVQASKQTLIQRGLTVFVDIFVPILPVIVGAGILLGIGNILSANDLFGTQSLASQFPQLESLTEMIHLVANTAFTYIPVLVAWSATKRFGGNPALGITLGMVLINENLLSGAQLSSVMAGTVKPNYWHLFGVKIMQVGYQNSVLAPLLAALLMVQIEKLLKKWLPGVLQTILVAPLAIFVAAFFTFLIIGPVANWLSTAIADPLVALFKTQPIIAGLIFGLIWEPLVVSGLHYALIAINLQLVATNQQSEMIAIIATICMAEVGADLAVALLNRQSEQRSVALSAAVSSLLGITEPSMFGVTIPQRYPFLCVMGSAGLAGMLVAASREYAVSAGPAGPLSLVIIPVQFWRLHGLILLITFLSGFIATLITGKIINQRAAQSARATELQL